MNNDTGSYRLNIMSTNFDIDLATDSTPMGVDELASALGGGRTVATIKADVHRRPHTLPPQTRLPGSNRNRWTAGVVRQWLENLKPIL